MLERIEMQGSVTLLLTDEDGCVVERRRYHNLILTSGRRVVAELVAGKSAGTITHIAVGTSANEPANIGRTALAKEVARASIEGATVEEVDTWEGRSIDTRVCATFSASFAKDVANGADPLREAGLIAQAGNGAVLYNRVVFPALVKDNKLKLTVSWDVLF